MTVSGALADMGGAACKLAKLWPLFRDNQLGSKLDILENMDIHAKALTLIREHGDEALARAAMEADHALQHADMERAYQWKTVASRIYHLLAAGESRIQ
jgi:hypothetical protein